MFGSQMLLAVFCIGFRQSLQPITLLYMLYGILTGRIKQDC